MAVVGQVPGLEHYRNIDRHEVLTQPQILSIRVDESLYFANARYLEDRFDVSALESLEEISRQLADAGIGFHL
ncbi:hypothetical protein [Mesorhizobium sp. Root157]|uniref:hypothetical protein n=1 Tax=Mesorhizobium sp. Root157 TaxID=1736477 RepID=UPI001910CF2E|nr:hypothetical protein [Mesorhizobium sp. Root157]